MECHHTAWHYEYRKLTTVSASPAVISTASKHLHNDLAKAIEALEQKKSWLVFFTSNFPVSKKMFVFQNLIRCLEKNYRADSECALKLLLSFSH